MYLDYPKRFGSQGLVVLPGYNFAFCTIPKVGSTMWEAVLFKMLTHNKSAASRMSKYEEAGADEKTRVFF